MLTSIDIPATQHTEAFDVMSEGFQIMMITLFIFMEHLNMEILLVLPLNPCVLQKNLKVGHLLVPKLN